MFFRPGARRVYKARPALQQQGAQKDPDHQECKRDFDCSPNRKPNPRGDASPSRSTEIAIHGQLADHGTDERAEDDAWQSEKQTSDRTESGADHRARTRTKMLRTEGGSGEVDEVACCGDNADYDQRPHADAREVLGPRRHHEADENEDVSRQCREDNADQSDNYQCKAQPVEKDGHTIASVSVTLLTSPRFADHLTPPGHPERVERFEVMQVVASEFRQRGGRVVEPRRATDVELTRIHDKEHVSLIKETAGRAVALDADTFTSPSTYDVACISAGAAVSAVELVLDAKPGARALAMVRPPGHHAERNRAMGFCFFNNIAVAAAHARARGLGRVAIVDYDVHHGNGTQWSFYADPSVLFISSHQYPYYPGTGAADDIGKDAGKGFTVNLPMAAGATDADYERAYAKVALPILTRFRPELILISAGFDAHMNDPLGGMRLTGPYFGRLTAAIVKIAEECCQGRVVAITEGGYDLAGLAESLRATIRALEGDASFEVPTGPTPRADATIDAVTPHLAKHWQL